MCIDDHVFYSVYVMSRPILQTAIVFHFVPSSNILDFKLQVVYGVIKAIQLRQFHLVII